MDLIKSISSLKASAERQLHALNTKEKTKNVLLLPFFNALGYDPFDVGDVEPAFPLQLQGEDRRRVDYALKVDGSPAILVQCAKAETDLDSYDEEPLSQWFPLLDTSVVARTNGLTYRLYADLPGQTEAAIQPFLEFDLLDHTAEDVKRLEPLTKASFDTETLLATAFEREYSERLKGYLARQRKTPDEHFVRFLAAQVFEGEVSKEAIEQFRPIVRDVLQQIVNGEIETREEVVSETDSAMSSNGSVPEILHEFEAATGGNGDGASKSVEPSPSSTETKTDASGDRAEPSPEPQTDRGQDGNADTQFDMGNSGRSTGNTDNRMRGESNIATEFAEKVLGRNGK